MILIVYLIGAVAWYSRSLPDPNKIIERNLEQSTKIYDREGKVVLYDVHGEKQRTLVKLEDIPDFVKWATLSAEDKNFYKHKGFNLLSMFKGVIIDPLLGRRIRGGSTLTQQFVKNAILTGERRISRKIKEFILSYKIERIFSKDEILQMYLNEIPYGSVSYGIQSASQTYFNKDVKDLTLAEAAILAALPKAPTYYSPFGSHKDELLGRQQYVLNQMVENNYITKEQAEKAEKEKIEFAMKKQSIIAPHFVMYVKEILGAKFGEELVETGGLKVITTIDLAKQKIAEEAVSAGVEKRGQQYNFYNAALASIDPKTGQILAMVGSKDYFDVEHDGNVNVCLSLRQPGSSIKPFVYLAAFQKGYTPNTVLYDTETIFKTETKDYHPLNYDLKEHGPVTMRQALAGSLNIPAVKTIYLVGVQKVIDLLELFGYTSFSDRSRFGLSLVLGGGEVKLLEHTAAYSALSQEGIYREPAAILKVEDAKGNTLFEFNANERKAGEKEYVNWVTNILSDNSARAYIFGAVNYLTLPDRPIAAKTGTTNDNHDAWALGYTPSLTAGVWVGNNDNSEMKKGADGSIVAAPIWQEYMQKALKGTPVEVFPSVDIKPVGKPALDGDVSAKQVVKIDKYSNKLATDLTPVSAIIEKVFTGGHTILHYVYKDIPQGPAPADPASADPAYQNWEDGVQKWIKKTYGTSGLAVADSQPPVEYDDVHIEANKPTIFISAPSENAVISSTNLSITVNASASRGIAKVEYYFDNVLLAIVSAPPFDLNYNLNTYFVRGYHKLKVKAYDDVENSNESAIDVNLAVDLPKPSVFWISPLDGASFSASSFPVKLQIQLSDLLSTKKANFYQRKKESGQINLIGTVLGPESENLTMDWAGVFEKGEYELFAEIVSVSGEHFQSAIVKVEVQ